MGANAMKEITYYNDASKNNKKCPKRTPLWAYNA
jgi:hypothetical protein